MTKAYQKQRHGHLLVALNYCMLHLYCNLYVNAAVAYEDIRPKSSRAPGIAGSYEFTGLIVTK